MPTTEMGFVKSIATQARVSGLRNFVRPFRGVNKKYLHPYIAIFEWGYNLKTATSRFLRALLGVFTSNAP